MTDSSSLIPIKDVYEILKELLGYGNEIVSFLFPNIPSKIAARRAENLIAVMKSAQKKLDEAGLKPEERNAIALKLGLPIIEKASLEEEPSLQELWANLLANALNPNHSHKARAFFINVIQSLSSLDVLVLNAFNISQQPFAVDTDNNTVLIYTEGGYRPYPNEVVSTCINVLKTLGLITDVELTTQLMLGNSGVFQQTGLHLTPLGTLFIDACIKDASK